MQVVPIPSTPVDASGEAVGEGDDISRSASAEGTHHQKGRGERQADRGMDIGDDKESERETIGERGLRERYAFKTRQKGRREFG